MIRLGPEDGTLTVRTGKAGAAAKAGHNLVIEVTRWQATLDRRRRSTLTADPRSLRVAGGSGGMLAARRRREGGIAQTIDEEVLKGGTIAFRSSARHAARRRPRRRGRARPARRPRGRSRSRSTLDGGHLTGRAAVKQTDWRIKPYSALFGTLKVADEVEVAIDATLPKESDDG